MQSNYSNKYIIPTLQDDDMVVEIEGSILKFHLYISESKDLPQKHYMIKVEKKELEAFVEIISKQ